MDRRPPIADTALGEKAVSPAGPWLFLILVLVFTAAIRFHLADVPLERDEGEYAYAGQLILQGVPPFAEAYNMKLPGAYLAYAGLIAVFGPSVIGLRLGLILINTAATILFFLVFKQRFEVRASALGAASFAVLSLAPSVQGFMLNAEHFVLLFSAAGLLALLKGMDANRPLVIFTSGLFLGLALVMKQHGVFFVLFGVFYLLVFFQAPGPGLWKRRLKLTVLYLLGTVIPFGLICFWLWRAGVFERFWFWTFSYAQEYVSQTGPVTGLSRLGLRMWDHLGDSLILWAWAALGLFIPFRDPRVWKHFSFLCPFVLMSWLSVWPGLYFRPHYFLLFLPAVGLPAGLAIWSVLADRFSRRKAGLVMAAVFVLSAAWQFGAEFNLYFRLTPQEISRQVYPEELFPEAAEAAAYIRSHSRPEDRVVVIGSDPQIYFYAGRRSAIGYMYLFPLFEDHPYVSKMQHEFMDQVEAGRPRFIVLMRTADQWLSPVMDPVWDWTQRFLAEHYRPVGLIEVIVSGKSRRGGQSYWGADLDINRPHPDEWVGVYERLGP